MTTQEEFDLSKQRVNLDYDENGKGVYAYYEKDVKEAVKILKEEIVKILKEEIRVYWMKTIKNKEAHFYIKLIEKDIDKIFGEKLIWTGKK